MYFIVFVKRHHAEALLHRVYAMLLQLFVTGARCADNLHGSIQGLILKKRLAQMNEYIGKTLRGNCHVFHDDDVGFKKECVEVAGCGGLINVNSVEQERGQCHLLFRIAFYSILFNSENTLSPLDIY